MDENIITAQYDLTKKSKIKKFYDKYKILIFLISFFLVISSIAGVIFFESKEKKRILLSESYVEAKTYLYNENKSEAKKILKTIILADDNTYSTLSLFLILNENLIEDREELSNLFDHVIKNNKLEKEIKNLLIFKRALFKSNYVNESELLEAVNPLINTETLWKPHALLMLGDYFAFKNEYLKAKEFYLQVLTLKNLHKELYDHAKSQLMLIENE
jgi:hypothetical protein